MFVNVYVILIFIINNKLHDYFAGIVLDANFYLNDNICILFYFILYIFYFTYVIFIVKSSHYVYFILLDSRHDDDYDSYMCYWRAIYENYNNNLYKLIYVLKLIDCINYVRMCSLFENDILMIFWYVLILLVLLVLWYFYIIVFVMMLVFLKMFI